jgi:hypothetical protein
MCGNPAGDGDNLQKSGKYPTFLKCLTMKAGIQNSTDILYTGYNSKTDP